MRSKYRGIVTSFETSNQAPLFFDHAPFSTEEPTCRLVYSMTMIEANYKWLLVNAVKNENFGKNLILAKVSSLRTCNCVLAPY